MESAAGMRGTPRAHQRRDSSASSHRNPMKFKYKGLAQPLLPGAGGRDRSGQGPGKALNIARSLKQTLGAPAAVGRNGLRQRWARSGTGARSARSWGGSASERSARRWHSSSGRSAAQRCASWQPIVSPGPRCCAIIFSQPACALLLESTERKVYANSRCRPRLEHFEAGASCVFFEAESTVLKKSGAWQLSARQRRTDTARKSRKKIDERSYQPLLG
jgi:hypothetical protein